MVFLLIGHDRFSYDCDIRSVRLPGEQRVERKELSVRQFIFLPMMQIFGVPFFFSESNFQFFAAINVANVSNLKAVESEFRDRGRSKFFVHLLIVLKSCVKALRDQEQQLTTDILG